MAATYRSRSTPVAVAVLMLCHRLASGPPPASSFPLHCDAFPPRSSLAPGSRRRRAPPARSRCPLLSVGHDHRADPRVGEDLQQDGVRQPPAEHVCLRHAAAGPAPPVVCVTAGALPGQSAYRPATSVSITSLTAPSATASAAAAVSAFTFSTSPVSLRATVEITGILPSAISALTAPGFTDSTSPTWPMSINSPSSVVAA